LTLVDYSPQKVQTRKPKDPQKPEGIVANF
jgi:hypothetical protein